MSKILLVKPRFITSFWQAAVTQPMGLMYIGAMLKNAGHAVKLHDCGSDHKDLHILTKTITDWKPDFIGLSIIITEVQETQRIMKIIHDRLPHVPVVFGGPWPSGNPEAALRTFGADFVVIGEGEYVFLQLIEAVSNGRSTRSIPGVASMVDGQVKANPGRFLTEEELNDLPFPAWDLLDHNLYATMRSMPGVGRRPYMAVVTSRGCPYRCAYCHQTMGKTFRKRSAESVVAEFEELRFKHGFKEFEIIDDCFNLDRDRMCAIFTGIQRRIGDARLHFPNAVRSDILEPEDLALFKRAGTVSACFAIESASPRIQKMIHKNLDIEKAACAIKASVKAGIYSTGYFMIGFPTETYKEALKTVKFAVRSPLHRALFFNPIPFAGTEMAEMAKDVLVNSQAAVFDPQIMNYHMVDLNISAMSDNEHRKIARYAYRRFYLSPVRAARIIKLAALHPELFSPQRLAGMFIRTFLPGLADLGESN